MKRYIKLGTYPPRGVCYNCGKPVKGKRKYCSQECAEAFYQKHLWELISKRIWERDHSTCRWCGRKLEYGEGNVHHIVPISEGGSNDDSNLVLLCTDCHAKIHKMLNCHKKNASLTQVMLFLNKYKKEVKNARKNVSEFYNKW